MSWYPFTNKFSYVPLFLSVFSSSVVVFPSVLKPPGVTVFAFAPQQVQAGARGGGRVAEVAAGDRGRADPRRGGLPVPGGHNAPASAGRGPHCDG